MDSNRNKENVDWSRFGLHVETAPRSRTYSGGFVGLGNEFDYGAGGHQASGANELFAEEQGDVPWWKSNFFISQPVLFGTWDGVFTSCLINIFGVIVFLRSGWMVGQAGILSAFGIIIATVFIALVTVLAAVGICERCRVESGGVYFLLSHVLGSRFGGSLGLLYCFGQAVGCALNILGFGESMAGVINMPNSTWIVRGIACAAVLSLAIINVAGVKWVIKLQFVLLLVLLLAGLDFIVGSFIHTDPEAGFDGWLKGNLANNTWPQYQEGYNWFTVFGVFFPTVTGVLSGINMSGDLRSPSINIPNGTLAAVSTGSILYFVFIMFLGATCTRQTLLTDFMIAAKVSAVRLLLLAGLYVSSMSSCLGAMYGTPRVLQSIAMENVIPGIGGLGRGRGPNKVPLNALVVVVTITLIFILIGKINTLAPVVTMPFLMTYACVDYAYFALAQSFDMQHQQEQRFYKTKTDIADLEDSSPNSDVSDLDKLFPERTHYKTIKKDNSKLTLQVDANSEVAPTSRKVYIHSKPNNWYSILCNRWLSLLGAIIKLLIMLFVNWKYAIVCFTTVFLVWLYIGTANPAVKPGLASSFKILRWIKNILLCCCGRRTQEYEQIVVTSTYPAVDITSSQLNEDNEDFASRRRYHQSATVYGHMVQVDD